VMAVGVVAEVAVAAMRFQGRGGSTPHSPRHGSFPQLERRKSLRSSTSRQPSSAALMISAGEGSRHPSKSPAETNKQTNSKGSVAGKYPILRDGTHLHNRGHFLHKQL
jgi:hypothetical protein